MSLKVNIRTALRNRYGEFNTVLEHQYEDRVTKNLIVGNQEKKEEWATYHNVIIELKNSIKDMLKVKELQYKLTENTNPNEVCIEVIEDVIGEVKNRTPELERLYYKIKNF